MRYVFAKKLGVVLGILLAGAAADSGEIRWLKITHHDLDVQLSPATSELKGSDRIVFETSDKGAHCFMLGSGFTPLEVKVDGKRVEVVNVEPPLKARGTDEAGPASDNPFEHVRVYQLPPIRRGEHEMTVVYHGVIYDTLKAPEDSRSGIPEETTGLIGAEGTYLCEETGWYPDVEDGFATFSIRATTPAGVEAVTEGKRLSVIKNDDKTVTDWEVSYPTQDVTLIAGEFIVHEKEMEGVTLMAYFFPSEQDLVDSYLEASGRYIRLYNGLIGPYPFSKFAVVENFFPTGYGMPSYTLLGRRVMRLPFIVETSLGHEVAHNWWGNSVYPDYEGGNWCEGLTTYYADYRYKEQQSDAAAAQYRRDVNINYTTFTAEGQDIPLAEFRRRHDDATRAVGYGKCMMVFHMLKNTIGEDKFYRAMRSFYERYAFKRADWDDIECVFEDVTRRPLDAYFDQWVKRTGAPLLELKNVQLSELDGEAEGYRLEVTIGNEGGFDLDAVPVDIVGPTKTSRLNVAISGESKTFDWRLDERPLRLAVDPDHHLFRRLDPAEIPVTIRRVLADTAVIVLPSRAAPEILDAYRELANRLARSGKATIAADTSLGAAMLSSSPVFVLGGTGENEAFDLLEPPDSVVLTPGGMRIDGVEYADDGHAVFAAYTCPLDSSRAVCAIVGNSPDAIRAAGHKVIYYGKYGFVTFLGGERQAAGEFAVTRNPLVYEFAE